MGNQMGSEEELARTLGDDYLLQPQSYMLHTRSSQLCSLRKVTTSSHEDILALQQNIQEYQRTSCQSISTLQAHFVRSHEGPCSSLSHFYLLFNGPDDYTLGEQLAKRRVYGQSFSEQQIQQVAETFLCGLREYSNRFRRQFECLSLHSIAVERLTGKLNLQDPLLQKERDKETSHPLLGYPSPQKLQALLSVKTLQVNVYLSNLFSVGVICLQLKRMQFADEVYFRKREVNFEEIGKQLKQIRSDKLRKGLKIMLEGDPHQRKKVYQFWGIDNQDQHHIRPIRVHSQQQPRKQYRERAPTQHLSTLKSNHSLYFSSSIDQDNSLRCNTDRISNQPVHYVASNFSSSQPATHRTFPQKERYGTTNDNHAQHYRGNSSNMQRIVSRSSLNPMSEANAGMVWQAQNGRNLAFNSTYRVAPSTNHPHFTQYEHKNSLNHNYSVKSFDKPSISVPQQNRQNSPHRFQLNNQQYLRNQANNQQFNRKLAENPSNHSFQRNNSRERQQQQVEEYVVQNEPRGRYQGYKSNGLRQGNGRLFYKDGSVYEGQWRNNQMHGFGKLYLPNCSLAYEGSWAADKYHGFGKLYNNQPVKLSQPFDYRNLDRVDKFWSSYEGSMVMNVKEGMGRLLLTNGQVFQGGFRGDVVEGRGKFYLRNKSTIEGVWKDSKLMQLIKF